MAMRTSTPVKNARLDAIESAIGASPVLELRTGARPTAISDADAGTVVATLNLPADWMATAANNVKALLGTWQDSAADAAGTVAHFRLKQGSTCHIDGTVTGTGGGGDITLDNPTLALGQQVTITAFNLSDL